MAHLRSIRRAQTPNPQALGITVPLPFGKPGTPRSPRAVARTKKNPGGEPGLSLGRTLGVFTLPDSPAAGRKVSRLPSSLDGPALPLGSLPAGQSLPIGDAMFYRHFSERHSRFRRFAARNYAVASRAASGGGAPAWAWDGHPPWGPGPATPSRAYKRDMKISRTSKSRGGREFPRRAGRIRAFRSAGGLAHGRTRKAGNESEVSATQLFGTTHWPPAAL